LTRPRVLNNLTSDGNLDARTHGAGTAIVYEFKLAPKEPFVFKLQLSLCSSEIIRTSLLSTKETKLANSRIKLWINQYFYNLWYRIFYRYL